MIAKKQTTTRTLAILAQKGGAGKTTLALHLAVIAHAAGHRTLIADADPQRSAAEWWKARDAEAPELAEVPSGRIRDVIQAAADDGVGLIVLDSRPSVEKDTAEAASLADFILIPTRPSILDLRAIGATVDIVKATKTPAAIVLNSCPPGRGPHEGSLTREARRGLEAYGLPIVPVSITGRAALAHALIDGRAVTEFEPGGKAAAELIKLWKWTEKKLW